MGVGGFVRRHKTFLSHRLNRAEDGGVGGFSVQVGMDVPDRRRALVP